MTAHFTHRRSWGITTRDAALAARLHDSDVYSDCSEAPPFEPIPDTRSIWIPALILLTFWTAVVLIGCAIVGRG